MSRSDLVHTLRTRYSFDAPLVEAGAVWPLLIFCIFSSVVMLGLLSGVIGYDGELDKLFLGLAALWMAGLGLQVLGALRTGLTIKAMSLFLLISTAGALSSAVLATVSLDYADAMLAQADRMLLPGLDWPALMRSIGGNAPLANFLSYTYASLSWQPMFTIAFFMIMGHAAHAWRIIGAFAIALALGVAIFPFFPAVGGYMYFNIPPADVPEVLVRAAWLAPELLHELKAGEVAYLGVKTLDGVITMPSFHAASAVIFAWAYLNSKYLR